jgi:hypothetical protein
MILYLSRVKNIEFFCFPLSKLKYAEIKSMKKKINKGIIVFKLKIQK